MMKKTLIALSLGLLACGEQGGSTNEKERVVEASDQENKQDETEEDGQDDGKKESDGFLLGPVPGNYGDWQDIELADPETASVAILDGQDPIAKSCIIYLMGVTVNTAGETQYIVRSSFSHNGEGHKLFVLSKPSTSLTNQIGRNIEDPGSIAAEFGAGTNFEDIVNVNIKWWHRDHFDINRCQDLVIRKSSEEDAARTLVLPTGLTELEDIHSADTDNFYLKRYQGWDPVKRAFGEEDTCFLFLMAFDRGGESEVYYFRTSFNHDGISHHAFAVEKPDELLEGELIESQLEDDPDSFLRLEAGVDEDLDPLQFTVKWLHSDHYHVDQCKDLRLIPSE